MDGDRGKSFALFSIRRRIPILFCARAPPLARFLACLNPPLSRASRGNDSRSFGERRWAIGERRGGQGKCANAYVQELEKERVREGEE